MFIKRVWIERAPGTDANPKNGSADVLVEVEGDELWQAQFVTIEHLQREMQLSLDVARDYTNVLWTTQFIALDSPHIIVEKITQETIENVVDNLMALGVFESIFKELSHTEEDVTAVEIEEVVHGTTP